MDSSPQLQATAGHQAAACSCSCLTQSSKQPALHVAVFYRHTPACACNSFEQQASCCCCAICCTPRSCCCRASDVPIDPETGEPVEVDTPNEVNLDAAAGHQAFCRTAALIAMAHIKDRHDGWRNNPCAQSCHGCVARSIEHAKSPTMHVTAPAVAAADGIWCWLPLPLPACSMSVRTSWAMLRCLMHWVWAWAGAR